MFELYKPRFKRIDDEAQQKGAPMLGSYVGDNGDEYQYKHVEGTSEMDMKTVMMTNYVGNWSMK